jgi:transcriptional regulator with XRE-family HTH domain
MAGQWLGSRQEGTPAAIDDAGPVIRQHRLAAGRTQVDVADAMEITQQHLSQIERGICSVSLGLRRRFAALLGIPPHALGLSAGGSRAASTQNAMAAALTERSRYPGHGSPRRRAT